MFNEIIYALPIVLISVFSVLTILVDVFTGSNRSISYYFNILALLLVGISAAYTMNIPAETFEALDTSTLLSKGQLTFGGFAAFADIIFSVAGILTIMASRTYLQREFSDYKEFYSLILFSVMGMIVIAHSANLLVLFIGIELMSIPFYILAGFIRTRILSVEASLKYFLLGAFATGFLLYGMALVYGATGTLYMNEISDAIITGNFEGIYLKIGLALIVIGLSFKVAAFPFHQWAPDVYTGAPTVVTGFMSTAGKAAALIAFIIVSKTMLPMVFNADTYSDSALYMKLNSTQILNVIAVISALTMLVGNISALVQKNVKRMLAYSSVAHAGYLLMGIVAHSEQGYSGILFYATAYMFMQIGAFIVVSVLERDEDKYLSFSDYSGLKQNHPFLAAVMAIFMFSLAGIPLFAGFPGKYMLFVSAIDAGYTWLTIVAVVSSIISMYFYIGLVLHIYFKDPGEQFAKADAKYPKFALVICTIAIFVLGVMPGGLMDLTRSFF